MPAITFMQIATTRRRRLPSSGTSPSHTVRRMFEKLDGVVKVGRQAQGDGKRRYMKLRIPKTVVQAVYEELIGPI
jgi:hypothetical protein